MTPPAFLQRLPNWLVWKYEQHAASTKPRKMPYYATTGSRRMGAQGGPADRAQLTTFKDAQLAAEKFDGVGLAILPGLDLVAVDFDNCVTDGRVHDAIEQLVTGTYAEISPSGRGVRAFFTGSLASRKSFAKQGHAFDVEFFGDSGFVTYTGNVLASCSILGNEDTVAELTPAIVALYNERFNDGRMTATEVASHKIDRDPLDTYEPRLELSLDEMRAALAKIGPDLDEPEWVKVGWAIAHETDKSDEGLALWHEWSSGALGDTSAKYDAEVCDAKWAYFGRNKGTPITFRSVLKLAKDATAKLDQAEKRKRFEVIPACDFAARPTPPWLIKNVLPEAGLGMVYGESGSGKSFFVLDLAAALASGGTWRKLNVRKCRVVYVAAEGAGGFVKRVKAYSLHHATSLDGLGVIADAPNLLNVDDVKPLTEAINAFGPVQVLIVDTLAQTTPGGNENSAEDMGKALGHCRALHAATGAMVLLVHHSGKDAAKGARGWSGIKAACDVELEVTRVDDDRCATVTKLKDGEDGAEFGFALTSVNLGQDADGDAITSCVIREIQVVKKPPVTGEWQGAVWQALNDFAGLTGEGMARDALIKEACTLGPQPADGERDRRRDKARRALSELMAKGALAEKDGFIVCGI